MEAYQWKQKWSESYFQKFQKQLMESFDMKKN